MWNAILQFLIFCVVLICALIPGIIVGMAGRGRTVASLFLGIILAIASIVVATSVTAQGLSFDFNGNIGIFSLSLVLYLLLLFICPILSAGIEKTFKKNAEVRSELSFAWGMAYSVPIIGAAICFPQLEFVRTHLLISGAFAVIGGPGLIFSTKAKTVKLANILKTNNIVVANFDFFDESDTDEDAKKKTYESYQKMMDSYVEDNACVKIEQDNFLIYVKTALYTKLSEKINELSETKLLFTMKDILAGATDKNTVVTSSQSKRQITLCLYMLYEHDELEVMENGIYNVQNTAEINAKLNDHYSKNGELIFSELSKEFAVPIDVLKEFVTATDWAYKPKFSTPQTPAVTEAKDILPQDETDTPVEPVDINDCTEDELAAVPRISKVMAKKAIAYRNEQGYFANLGQFFTVIGVQPHMIDTLGMYLVVSEKSEPSKATVKQSRGRMLDLEAEQQASQQPKETKKQNRGRVLDWE